MSRERFGPYEIVRLIGRGGMGEVAEAHDVEQDRTVALKRLIPHLAEDSEFRRRFQRESRVAARLSNPHVIPIHRAGEIDGRLFIDMRLVRGADLEQLLVAEGRLEASRAVRLLAQIAWALDDAHEAGLVHRDIKPSNVLVERGSDGQELAYLADFGISRAVSAQSVSLTSTHGVLGTLDYMAPEQFDGTAVQGSDIYSLGCLLFQCLTGCRPYPVDGFPALMRAHLSRPAPAPSDLVPEFGTEIDEVVARAMAKEPGDRYASAVALCSAAADAIGSRVLHPARGGGGGSRVDEEAVPGDGPGFTEPATPGGRDTLPEPRPASEPRTASDATAPQEHDPVRPDEPVVLLDGSGRRRRLLPWLMAAAVLVLALGAGGAALLVGSPTGTNAATTSVTPSSVVAAPVVQTTPVAASSSPRSQARQPSPSEVLAVPNRLHRIVP